jgi:glutathione S-transferase
MKLYGAIASPYVTRVLMFARIKGVDLAISETPGGNIKSPEYLKLNPIGKVPTLEVSGFGIPESAVICDYLEDAHPQKSGLPKDPVDRAKSRLVARLVDLYLAPAVGTFFRQMNPVTRDQKAVDTATADLNKVFGYLEHFMGPGPFAVAAQPTLGDCALAPYILLTRKLVFANFPNVKDPTTGTGRLAKWWNAVQGHPELKGLLDEYSTAVDSFSKAMAARARPA